MPLYEYQCKKCNKVFEVMQKFSDEPLKKHEGCGGKVEKQMSAPAFHLKGTGWYVTDYGKGGVVPKDTSSSESKADSKAESKSEAKSENTKPETKSESTKSESKAESKSASKSDSKPPATSSK